MQNLIQELRAPKLVTIGEKVLPKPPTLLNLRAANVIEEAQQIVQGLARHNEQLVNEITEYENQVKRLIARIDALSAACNNPASPAEVSPSITTCAGPEVSSS